MYSERQAIMHRRKALLLVHSTVTVCCLVWLQTAAAKTTADPAISVAPATVSTEPAAPAKTSESAADEQTADTASADKPKPSSKPTSPSAQEQVWLDALARQEGSGGAFDPGLTQQLLGLGRVYQQENRHLEAVAVLDRAAHIARINEGLYSGADIPILEMLIESYAALGDWDEVSNRYLRMFRTLHKRYGGNDVRLLPPIRQLAAWHLRAFLGNLGEDPLNHLLAARNLYGSSVAIMQANYAPTDARLMQALRESVLVNFYLAQQQPTEAGGVRFGEPAPMQSASVSYQVQGFNSGRDALEKIVEVHRNNPTSSAEDRARAIAELGDWHLLFSRVQTALDLYREAYATVAQSGMPTQEVSGMFETPVTLPIVAHELFSSVASSKEATANPQITANFLVNARGRAQDITIADATPPAPEQHIAKLRRLVRNMLFRPRLLDGEAVPAPGISYVYTYKP